MMGPYVNTRLQNVIDGTIVVTVIAVSSLYGLSTLFPNLLGG